MINPNKKIVQLLRGFCSLPIIAHLGKTGELNHWLESSSVNIDDFTKGHHKKRVILNYLETIGLISIDESMKNFKCTKLGASVFSRHGAFNILHSYKSYFEHIDQFFTDDLTALSVDRVENVYGSGQIHKKKYFMDASNLIQNPISTHYDLACGDGSFLLHMKEAHPQLQLSVGIDLSKEAIKCSENTFLQNNIHNFELILNDGLNVQEWSRKTSHFPKPDVISMWFFLHEVSGKSTTKLINFFHQLYASFPHSSILICENVNLSSHEMLDDNDLTAAPEFLLIHELSNQGVLSWDQYQCILTEIPYHLRKEVKYNVLTHNQIPSSFIWLLEPKA